MLVYLSDVLTSEGKRRTEELPLEMTCFESRMGCFPISKSSPVSFVFTNLGTGKLRIQGGVALTFQTGCDRCLRDVPTVLDLHFDRIAVCPLPWLRAGQVLSTVLGLVFILGLDVCSQ